MKLLKNSAYRAHGPFCVRSFKIVYSAGGSSEANRYVFLWEKKKVRSITDALRLNRFLYYTTIKGHIDFLTNAFCVEGKKTDPCTGYVRDITHVHQ